MNLTDQYDINIQTVKYANFVLYGKLIDCGFQTPIVI